MGVAGRPGPGGGDGRSAAADAFNQQGQNWSLPPWHPRKLAEAGYKPYRDLLRAVSGTRRAAVSTTSRAVAAVVDPGRRRPQGHVRPLRR
ncbi:4-alpha-glucanotransferase [Kutzneria kofuensis]|uniref:4-alpha-glucanotransferase n=1 Tax=Kutzneria kofuensis TaxID=103725 RepID=UPI003CD0641C